MKSYSYFRETLNTLTQFTAAFDDCVVWRYDKNFEKKEKINARYVFGPKHRVLYDIVNQAKNITLPVISIDQTNVKRDSSRIQFKDQKITRRNLLDDSVSRIPSPIPVTMDLNVAMVANYKEDIDQIASNIFQWFNPYIIISCKIPEEFGMDFIDEIRTEATWNGSVEYENPINITASDKYKIVGNTSFNVKGWIFPALETPQAPIYVVNTNFIAVSSGSILNGYDDYWSLSANNSTDSILISAYPEFTNYFINGVHQDGGNFNFTTTELNDRNFTFYGKRFGFDNTWYINSDFDIPELVYTEIVTVKYPTISAYKIPDDLITVVNDNIVTISFDYNYFSGLSGNIVFVTANDAGWISSAPID